MARQQLAKAAGPKREARVRQLVVEKTSKREAAVAAASSLSMCGSARLEVNELDADVSDGRDEQVASNEEVEGLDALADRLA